MPHQCKSLVIACMDYRFHSSLRDFLLSLGLKDNYDMVSLAGSAKGLVDREAASSEVILKQVDISSHLHHISEIYLVHHMDCGAYGGHAAFVNLTTERKKQIDDLAIAAKLIKEKFPHLVVKKILARIEEKDNQSVIDFEAVN